MAKPLPLTKRNRLLVARAFANVLRVDMSIDCVVEDQMGDVWVDDVQTPAVFKLKIGPFTYFAGEATSAAGQALLDTMRPYNMLMPSAAGWAEAAQNTFSERLVTINRYRYSSEKLSLPYVHTLIEQANLPYQTKLIDLDFANHLWAQKHFVSDSDYESAEDFVQRGVGYYMEENGEVIGVAYASLSCSRGIEVSIFVQEAYRRQGLATVLGAYLISWCLERKLHPNWDAGNLMSCGLAEKLGYVSLGPYQAYYLKP